MLLEDGNKVEYVGVFVSGERCFLERTDVELFVILQLVRLEEIPVDDLPSGSVGAIRAILREPWH